MKYNKDILDRFINEKVAINVETQQEWDDFMKLLEKETDCRWSNAYLPTNHDYWNDYKEDTSVAFNSYDWHILKVGPGYSFKGESCETIRYKDLIKGEETMTNIEKVNKALENADEDKIKEVLDFLGYKEDGKFIPRNQERYYFINALGDIYYCRWRDDKYDEYRLLMNNVYRTSEEAEKALDLQTRKAKLIKEIKDSSDAIDWRDDSQYKCYLFYDYKINEVIYHYSMMHKSSGVTYTTNKKFLKELIKERSDEVKELLFGIKS